MTRPRQLEGALRRIYRAQAHIEDLRPRIAELEQQQRDELIAHFTEQRWQPNEHYSVFLPAPMTVAILIGEICYNLRTALEYLVFELAKLDAGSAQDFTQFPIVDEEPSFREWAKRARRKGITDEHIARFESLQPYCGCDWTGVLRDLSNKDKHQEFVQLGGSTSAKVYIFPGDLEFDRIASPVFQTRHPETGEEVSARIEVTTALSFRAYRAERGNPFYKTSTKGSRSTRSTVGAGRTPPRARGGMYRLDNGNPARQADRGAALPLAETRQSSQQGRCLNSCIENIRNNFFPKY